MNINFKFTILTDDVINSSNILINSTSGEENTVRSNLLGGTRTKNCGTCSLAKTSGDMGHIGKVELGDDTCIILPAFIKKVLSILNLLRLCPYCGLFKNNKIDQIVAKSIINDEVSKDLISELRSKQPMCKKPNCNMVSGSYKYSYAKAAFTVKTKINEIIIPNNKIREMLQMVPTIVYKILSKHKDDPITPYNALYLKCLYISPIVVRPPNIYDNRESDVRTSKLNALVNACIKRKSTNEIQKIVNEIDNNKGSSPYSKKQQLITSETLVGGTKKEGILRSNIVARRCDNTARCVLGPTTESIGTINIPRIVADKLTQSIIYNVYTRSYVLNLVNNTNEVVNIRLNNESELKQIRLIKPKINSKISSYMNLKYGDAIEMHLNDGSLVIFGRQPSLHKFNIQCAKVKIWDNMTIGAPTPIVNSMNADFDGDEVNIYKPLIEDTEFMITMNSANILKNNYNFSPAFGLIQDQIISIHLLYAMPNMDLDTIKYILGKFKYLLGDIKECNGKELLSLLLPDNISFEGYFKNGKFTLPYIDSTHIVSQSYKSIINILSHCRGNRYAVDFLDNILYISRRFLEYRGFSISILDLIPSDNIVINARNYTNNFMNMLQYVLYLYYKNAVNSKHPLLTYDELVDLKAANCNILSSNLKKKIVEEFAKYSNNGINIMKSSKYKMSDNEMLSLIGLNGFQQSGKLQPRILSMGRIFSFILPSSIDVQNFGFVTSSLVDGLSYEESCFHSKYASNNKILDKTCKTSDAGTIGKKLVKFMSDLIIDDNQMASINNVVVMNNPNYIKIMGQDICLVDIIKPSKEMYNYEYIDSLYKKLEPFFIYDFGTRSIKEFIFPININLEIGSYINNDINTINNNELIVYVKNFMTEISREIYFDLVDLSWFEYVLLTYLDPNIIEIKLSKEFIDYIFDKLRLILNISISPGYPIGLDYAHSIQEKFTQQSLSSFHTNTKSGATVTQVGFSDFKDTIELSKHNKQDIVTIYSTDISKLNNIKYIFEYMTLSYLDPDIHIMSETQNELTMKITIHESYLSNKCSIYTYYDIYDNFFKTMSILKSYWLTIDFEEQNIIIQFYVKVKDNAIINKNYIKLMLKEGISKGNYENRNLDVETLSLHDSNKIHRISFYIDKVTDLSFIDTRDLIVELGPWNTYDILGIQFMEYSIHNRLIKTTKENSLENCYRLVSKLMCLGTEPTNIKKLKDSGSCVIKSAIHGINDSFVNASWNNITDKCKDIYSCIFNNRYINVGHCRYTYYYDVNQLDNLSFVKYDDKKERNVQSEIIEDI